MRGSTNERITERGKKASNRKMAEHISNSNPVIYTQLVTHILKAVIELKEARRAGWQSGAI